MADKKHAPAPKEQDYYQLHTGAIDNLVDANRENTPRYSQQELDRYKSKRFKWRFPEPLKALLIKYWFYGAICFFVFMGLGVYVTAMMDMFFIAAVIMGLVTDLLINHFLRFTEKMPGGSGKWMMVTRRGTKGLVLNIVYGFVIMFLVMHAYQLINTLLSALGGENALLLRVEPLCFGLFATLADMLCISAKRLMMKIIADAKKSVK